MAARGFVCGSKRVDVWQQKGLYVAASVAVVWQQHRFLDMFFHRNVLNIMAGSLSNTKYHNRLACYHTHATPHQGSGSW